MKATLQYVTDEGEEFESTSTQTTTVSDSKGNKIQIDPNEELLKKIELEKYLLLCLKILIKLL